MNGTAVFSECGLYRYWLTRELAESGPTVAFVMLNPSTADAEKLDPTVRRCIGYAQRWGASRLIVVNIFALRSTDPKALYAAVDPIGQENNQYIQRAAREADTVVCAWGTHGAHREEGARAYWSLYIGGGEPTALAVTKQGHPAHPLYLRGDLQPMPYAGPRSCA